MKTRRSGLAGAALDIAGTPEYPSGGPTWCPNNAHRPSSSDLNLDEHATADLVALAFQNPGTPVAIVLETTGTNEGYALTQLDANR